MSFLALEFIARVEIFCKGLSQRSLVICNSFASVFVVILLCNWNNFELQMVLGQWLIKMTNQHFVFKKIYFKEVVF